MIAILHTEGTISVLLDKVIALESETITTETGGAKGVKHETLVVSDYTYGEEIVPATYIDVVRQELDSLGMPREVIDKVIATPEQVKPYIKKGAKRYDIGDNIDVSKFTDTRAQLPMTQAQIDRQTMDDLVIQMADLIMGGI